MVTNMKILVFSDSHGRLGHMMDAMERERPRRVFFLGDCYRDGEALRNAYPDVPMELVRGNCDCEVDQMVLSFPLLADYALVEWEGLTLYATHGHLWNEECPPPMAEGTVLLNGHFHVPAARNHGSWHYINPGSTSIPKDGSANSYLVLEDRVFTWKDMDGQAYQTYRVE